MIFVDVDDGADEFRELIGDDEESLIIAPEDGQKESLILLGLRIAAW